MISYKNLLGTKNNLRYKLLYNLIFIIYMISISMTSLKNLDNMI
jgi:hypothetical protein